MRLPSSARLTVHGFPAQHLPPSQLLDLARWRSPRRMRGVLTMTAPPRALVPRRPLARLRCRTTWPERRVARLQAGGGANDRRAAIATNAVWRFPPHHAGMGGTGSRSSTRTTTWRSTPSDRAGSGPNPSTSRRGPPHRMPLRHDIPPSRFLSASTLDAPCTSASARCAGRSAGAGDCLLPSPASPTAPGSRRACAAIDDGARSVRARPPVEMWGHGPCGRLRRCLRSIATAGACRVYEAPSRRPYRVGKDGTTDTTWHARRGRLGQPLSTNRVRVDSTQPSQLEEPHAARPPRRQVACPTIPTIAEWRTFDRVRDCRRLRIGPPSSTTAPTEGMLTIDTRADMIEPPQVVSAPWPGAIDVAHYLCAITAKAMGGSLIQVRTPFRLGSWLAEPTPAQPSNVAVPLTRSPAPLPSSAGGSASHRTQLSPRCIAAMATPACPSSAMAVNPNRSPAPDRGPASFRHGEPESCIRGPRSGPAAARRPLRHMTSGAVPKWRSRSNAP